MVELAIQLLQILPTAERQHWPEVDSTAYRCREDSCCGAKQVGQQEQLPAGQEFLMAPRRLLARRGQVEKTDHCLRVSEAMAF